MPQWSRADRAQNEMLLLPSWKPFCNHAWLCTQLSLVPCRQLGYATQAASMDTSSCQHATALPVPALPPWSGLAALSPSGGIDKAAPKRALLPDWKLF
jgi:hypothetical protein